jgi:hypothetical protein
MVQPLFYEAVFKNDFRDGSAGFAGADGPSQPEQSFVQLAARAAQSHLATRCPHVFCVLRRRLFDGDRHARRRRQIGLQRRRLHQTCQAQAGKVSALNHCRTVTKGPY